MLICVHSCSYHEQLEQVERQKTHELYNTAKKVFGGVAIVDDNLTDVITTSYFSHTI